MSREKSEAHSSGKLYEEVAKDLRRAIALGRLRAGDQLPSTRKLAASIGVSRNTVLMAYRILRIEQLTISRERGRIRVANTELTDRSGPMPMTVDPQSHYAARVRNIASQLADQFHTSAHRDVRPSASSDRELMRMWGRKLAIAARAVDPEYPDPQGFLPLRRAVVRWLACKRGINCTANDILIVRGVQQAITLVARVLLDEGDVVAIEEPGSPRVREALIAHGARVVGVRTDEHGILTDELAREKPRLICVSPAGQFPTSADMSADRRVGLLQAASCRRSWILEDDSNSEFRTRKGVPPTLRAQDQSDTVIYAYTFWQTVFPSLCLGFIVCPRGIHHDLCAAKRLADLGCPLAEQAALATLMGSQQWDKQISRARDDLERRRVVLRRALLRHCGERVLVQEPQDGIHLVVWLRSLNYSQLNQLVELGTSRGVDLYPVDTWYIRRPEIPGLILRCVGQSVDAIERVGAVLGKCLGEIEGKRPGRSVAFDESVEKDGASEWRSRC